jgi:hypothetical protein
MGVELAGADRLMVLNKISLIMPLPGSYMEQGAGDRGVKDVTHANWFGGYYQETKNQFANMAVEPRAGSACTRSSPCRTSRRRRGLPTARARSSASTR